MGLFSRFKSKISGGVDVHVQAPSAVPSNQVIPVTVNVTSASSQTITGIKVELKAQEREQGFSVGRGVGVQEGETTAQTVSQAENRDTFSIGPGETKSVNLQLFLNGGAGVPSAGQMGSVGGALQGVVNVIQNFEHVNYLYTVHAYVHVQGHTLSPSDKQSIQILPPAVDAQEPQQSASANPPTSVN